MSLNSSILAYEDCRTFLDRALDDAKGARRPFRTEKQALYWRLRCNKFRSLDRQQNMRIHEPGHKMYGQSDYDLLVMTIREGTDAFWVYAEKQHLDEGEIEALSEVPEITYEEVRFLEDHSNDDEAANGDVS